MFVYETCTTEQNAQNEYICKTASRYQWYQNGRLLDAILDTEANFYVIHPAHLGNLHIRTKHLITNGYYQCLASNDYGVAMSNITRLQEAGIYISLSLDIQYCKCASQ